MSRWRSSSCRRPLTLGSMSIPMRCGESSPTVAIFRPMPTRPWTAMKSYKRDPKPQPYWHEDVCPENNPHIRIGQEIYMLSSDGFLMPQKKSQKPPDLRYFEQV